MIEVTFDGRRPNPRKIRIGVEMDNIVEEVRFRLPVIAENQTATLHWNNDKGGDAVLLEEGVWRIGSDITQYAGMSACYIAISADNDALWHSEAFYVVVYDLGSLSGSVERRFPALIDDILAAVSEANFPIEFRINENMELEGVYSWQRSSTTEE